MRFHKSTHWQDSNESSTKYQKGKTRETFTTNELFLTSSKHFGKEPNRVNSCLNPTISLSNSPYPPPCLLRSRPHILMETIKLITDLKFIQTKKIGTVVFIFEPIL